MPAWKLFTEFVTAPKVAQFYTINALATGGYHFPRKYGGKCVPTHIIPDQTGIANWVQSEYRSGLSDVEKHKGTVFHTNIHLQPVFTSNDSILRTIDSIIQIDPYIKYVKKPILANVFAQADLTWEPAESISEPRRRKQLSSKSTQP
jgi:hypothetical protein